MHLPLVDLRRQYQSIKEEIDEAVGRVLNESSFILGSDVSLFESEFAAYCGAGFAVGVDSGMSALELGMLALGIGPGDEVVTPVNSFIASSAAISATGARPVFADVDPLTYNIDREQVKEKITSRTKAVMPVHLYGQAADMEGVREVAEAYGLSLIEDACQAHGARYRGQRVGSLGQVAAFSFYPSKNLGAYGDGGMVVTNDPALAEAVMVMRNYGQKEKNRHVVLPRNRRLDSIQAAILRVKLRYLDAWNQRRRELASLYDAFLDGTKVVRPHVDRLCEHVYNLYVVQTDNRNELQGHLTSKGISTAVHYPNPIHLQPIYGGTHRRGEFAVAEHCADRILSLPIFPELTGEEVDFIAMAVKEVCA